MVLGNRASSILKNKQFMCPGEELQKIYTFTIIDE